MSEFKLTKHAIERALDMNLSAEFIRELMVRPDSKRWSESDKHGACWLLRKGDVAAPCDEVDGVLQARTFLPATKEAWIREDANPIPGRRFMEERW